MDCLSTVKCTLNARLPSAICYSPFAYLPSPTRSGYNPPMSDIPLYEPDEEMPLPLPRAEVRFTAINVKPYPDGRRVKLNFTLTPFLERPSVEAFVTNASGQEVASLSLIEAMDTDFDFTIHLRGPQPQGEHTLRLVLFYTQNDDTPTESRQVVTEETATFVL